MNQMKISVYGQFNNDTGHIFTYPAIPDTKVVNPNTEWLRSIKDPRTVARQFQVADEAFVMWKAAAGTYYALVTPNKADNRGGYLQVTLMVGKRIVNSGSKLVDVLRKLKTVLIDNLSKDPAQVEAIIRELSPIPEGKRFVAPMPQRPAAPKSGAPTPKPSTPVGNAIHTGYCEYNSQADLETILENVEMDGVNNCSAVWAVRHTGAPLQLQGLTQLGFLKTKTYVVVMGGTAITDKKDAKDGDQIAITYKKKGCVDVKKTVVVGPGAKELNILGRTIHLREADEVGIDFKRGITIKVKDALTRATISSEVTLNKKPFTSGNPVAISGNSVDIAVEAHGYKKEVVKITQKDIDSGEITVYLKHEVQEVPLTIYDEKGTRHSGTVQVPYGDFSKFLLKVSRSSEHVRMGGNSKGNNDLLKMLLGLVIGAVLTFGGLWISGTLNFGEEETTTAGPTDSDKQGKEGESEVVEVDDAANEVADITYMKAEDTWDETKIKSAKFKKVYEAFKFANREEDLNTIVSCLPLFGEEDKANGYLISISKKLSRLNENDRGSMMDKIGNECQTGKVNLKRIDNLLGENTDTHRRNNDNAEPTNSAQPAAPTQTNRTTDPAQTNRTTTPAQTNRTTTPAQTNRTTTPAQTNRTTTPAQTTPTQPTRPGGGLPTPQDGTKIKRSTSGGGDPD